MFKKVKNHIINKFKIMDKIKAKEQLDKLKSDFDKYSKDVNEQMKILSKIIESPFGDIKIPEGINDYNDILKAWNVQASDDEVNIKGFDHDENEVVKNVIRKIRACKVYNGGNIAKRGDTRWYTWYNVSSGFAFYDTAYGVTYAGTASASRLCFLEQVNANDFAKKFQYIDEAIIDLH